MELGQLMQNLEEHLRLVDADVAALGAALDSRSLLKRELAGDRLSSTELPGQPPISVDGWDVLVGGEPLNLTKKERQALRILCINRGRVVEFGQFSDVLWPVEGGTNQQVTGLVHRLRNKLGPHGLSTLIESVPDIGYRMRK